MNVVRVDSRAGRDLLRGRPWVFSNFVRERPADAAPGEVVRVIAGEGARERDCGVAFYNPHSLIALRAWSREGAAPDAAELTARLERARDLRARLFPDSESHRLCHGEADFVPGLVVDRHGDVAVVQSFAAGMDRLREAIIEALRDGLGFSTIVERSESHARGLEGLEPRVGMLAGDPPGVLELRQPPIVAVVEPLTGQKTGAFLDQRENRAAAARHAEGRRALDLYCHGAGFGVHAARAGAHEVLAIDSSADAVAVARRAVQVNGVEGAVEVREADAEKEMEALHARRERFGLVMIDPPSFTRSRKHVAGAKRALQRLNRRAMTLVERDGILVSSSCSQHVREDVFLGVLSAAAAEAERELVLLEVRGASPDHPVLAALPETRYLTCVIARVR